MNQEFNRCLEKGKIVKFEAGPSMVKKELDTAKDDLVSSQDSYQRGNFKWATIQAYYSTFHSARALIYKQKYREKSHYCLIVALEHLYVNRGIIEKDFAEYILAGKEMRESADYHYNFSKDSSEIMIEVAGKFLSITKNILDNSQS